MIFTPVSFVFVTTMVHFRPYLTALRIRKPWYKCTKANCGLFAKSAGKSVAPQISRDLLEVNIASLGELFSWSTTLTIRESSAGYECDLLEHLSALNEVTHHIMGQVQPPTADPAQIPAR